MIRRWRVASVVVFAAMLPLLLLFLWLARAELGARLARDYFQSHGVASDVVIGHLGLSGVSGRFALGPRDAPTIVADSIELRFDPLQWSPRLVEVRLANPLVRAQVTEDGTIILPSLQDWLRSLQSGSGHSAFVSDDLVVSLTGLRALLATPAGAVELDGDVRLERNLPVSARLSVKPGRLQWKETIVAVQAASLMFDKKSARLRIHAEATLASGGAAVQDARTDLSADGFVWNGSSVTASRVHLSGTATAAPFVGKPSLDVAARNVTLLLAHGIDGAADVKGTAAADISGGAAKFLTAADPALAKAVGANLAHLAVTFEGRLARHGAAMQLLLTAPLVLRGAHGAVLDVPAMTLRGGADHLDGAFNASLQGGGLPPVHLGLQKFAWTQSGGFTGDLTFGATFNLAMLRGAALAGGGTLSWKTGQFAFRPATCLHPTLSAFRTSGGDAARDLRGTLCALPGQPLIAGDAAGWRLAGNLNAASVLLPPADIQVSDFAGGFSFTDLQGALSGNIGIKTVRVLDHAAAPRFHPLLASGTMALAGGTWRGKLALTDRQKNLMGDVSIVHALASGAGAAHIAAPHLTFVPGKLQPETIAPSLAAFRRAEGVVGFSGDIAWAHGTLNSRGALAIDNLDFLTPLGKAHSVKTSIAFVSLLPPVSADDQGVTIDRIDWTLPFSAIDLHFGFDPATVSVRAASTGIAEGRVALGAFTVKLADPAHLAGTAQLTGIALNSLVTASNLGAKVKLDGKISGQVPFAVTPDGFRIANGHIASDGPGRLSIDRSLWGQGDVKADVQAGTNAVQDFAYQALEHLAFDSLTADLNSVANGRLQVVFHIKGRSDPPKLQTADIAVTDLINGTAFQKPIPLPSGTPIDLTLDTSLNFDELLGSYTGAWSRSLRPLAAPTPAQGASK